MQGYIGEIFSSFQGEGVYAGRRQIFIRFLGCNLNCCYCDTQSFKKPKQQFCKIEKEPGTGEFISFKNPMPLEVVVDHIDRLTSPDLHSVSFTGGEPLLTDTFLISIAKKCHESGLKNYLETGGTSSKKFERVIRFFDYAAIDIKLPNHNAVPKDGFSKLYENEIDCIKTSFGLNVETIIKVVLLKGTKIDEFEKICKDLSGLTPDKPFYFVIQPVTQTEGLEAVKKPSIEEIFRFSELAGRYIDNVFVIPQIHKQIGVL